MNWFKYLDASPSQGKYITPPLKRRNNYRSIKRLYIC